MASASLEDEGVIAGRPTYRVFTEPWRAKPFSGPPGRNWAGFETDGSSASYEWRSGIDVLRDAAREAAAGTLTLKQVLAMPQLETWFELSGDQYFADNDETEGEELSDTDLCRLLLEGVRSGSIDPDDYEGPYAFYPMESDNFMADAACALDLPSWAKVSFKDDGGVGTSFTASFITLDPGKTLVDLGEWLSKQ